MHAVQTHVHTYVSTYSTHGQRMFAVPCRPHQLAVTLPAAPAGCTLPAATAGCTLPAAPAGRDPLTLVLQMYMPLVLSLVLTCVVL